MNIVFRNAFQRGHIVWSLLRLCLVMWSLLIPSLLTLLLRPSYLYCLMPCPFYTVSLYTVLELESYVTDILNLVQTHKLNGTIGLEDWIEDWIEDLGFIPSFCIHALFGISRPLSSTLANDGHMHNCYDWAQSFDKLKRALIFIPVMHLLWSILLVTIDFQPF